MTTTYNAFGVLTIQEPWFCACDRELEALGEPADPCGFLPLQHDRPRLHDAAGAAP